MVACRSSLSSPRQVQPPILSSDLLAELLGIVAEISAVLEPDELLPTIASKLRRIVNYRILDIFLPEPDGTLRPALALGYAAELASRLRIRPGEGIVGAAALAREPVFELGETILNDLALFMDGARPSDDVTTVVVRIL